MDSHATEWPPEIDYVDLDEGAREPDEVVQDIFEELPPARRGERSIDHWEPIGLVDSGASRRAPP